MRGDTRPPGLLFQGSDVEELHDLVSRRFAPHRMSVRGGHPMDGRFRCLHQGELGLYELGYGAEVDVVPGELPEFYNVHIPLRGGGTITTDGVTQPSALCLVCPGQRLAMLWDGECLNQVLNIPKSCLDRALTARLGDEPSAPLAFTPVLDPRTRPVATWLRLVREFAEFASSELADRSPLGTAHWELVLVHGLLDAQPHRLSEAVVGRGPAVLPCAVRRATVFCAEHAHEPIGVADMARAARVSIRSLRTGFRTHLGTTPLGHLRRVRLDLVHRELLALADGHGTGTVTDVALRWGFTHLGRFAGLYRQVYGESPSATLRRGRDCPERAAPQAADG
ncbi:AraC family transcriptional regulator [Streptomyces sp. NPDC048172]|uniref:AraC family transcriptional regulator n=1 Tax=Streptomyces sp. NPDC048172 TaxID=3365505 RepID=UPI0037105BA7